MKEYKAIVRDKDTREVITIISSYKTKQEFINDLRKNGYITYQSNVTINK